MVLGNASKAASQGFTSMVGSIRSSGVAGKIFTPGNIIEAGYIGYQATQSGENLAGAVMRETAWAAAFHAAPALTMAVQMAPMVYEGTKALHTFRYNRSREMFDMVNNSYGKVGGGYMDTEQAYTMRQAAVQQIQGNKLNARSALGGEARMFSSMPRR